MNNRRNNPVSSHLKPVYAGDHILTNIPTAKLQEKVFDVKKRILNKRKHWDSINYIYIFNAKEKLMGVVSIKELLESPEREKMLKFKKTKIIVAHPYSKLSVVASKAITNNIKALPVVGSDGKFLGVIGPDLIFDVLEREHVRDILTSSGIQPEKGTFVDVLSAKISTLIKWRTPWLLVGVLGGMITTTIVEGFTNDIEQAIEIAFFIPVMLYLGAAIGNQTQLLFIRGLAYQQINVKAYLLREIIMDIFIGLIISIILGAFAFYSTKHVMIAVIVWTATLTIVSTAGVLAILTSYLFIKLKKDPALGGGPFSTIIQDVTSLLIYFTVATMLLF